MITAECACALLVEHAGALLEHAVHEFFDHCWVQLPEHLVHRLGLLRVVHRLLDHLQVNCLLRSIREPLVLPRGRFRQAGEDLESVIQARDLRQCSPLVHRDELGLFSIRSKSCVLDHIYIDFSGMVLA